MATKLGEILGVSADTSAAPIAVVKCQGNRDLTNDIMEYGKEMTCTAASQLFGGGKGCSSGCLGLGDCVRVCDFDAIHVVNGVAIVSCVPRIPTEPSRTVNVSPIICAARSPRMTMSGSA